MTDEAICGRAEECSREDVKEPENDTVSSDGREVEVDHDLECFVSMKGRIEDGGSICLIYKIWDAKDKKK